MQEVGPDCVDATCGVERDLGVMDLAALLVRTDEVLPAVLRPLHVATQSQRGIREEDLLRVEDHDLRAEAAADVGRLQVELIRGQAEQPAKAELERDRRLRRCPDAHPTATPVPVRGHAATLERAGETALDD